ncbi:MFS transporter [Pigmentibacter sp. JX0631]|uniref:MFS transporter n=1 Tax=Pigmentibacter sp. JX0631 TaxID=2976982 RepID=UPI002468746D|nr:MFS transporter [Pigmentibacter sp. JX0631]WGL58543.1 MFS transporter [Pigmentibacter sp. JX0631]
MSKQNKILAFLFVTFLLVYEFSVYIANDMIMPAMINIVNEFNVSDSFIASSLSIFILGGATLQLLLGPLSDKYGSRKIMLGGVMLFFAATIFNGLSRNIEEFLISRFLQGMGICYIGVIGYAKIQQMFEEKLAVRIISIMTTVSIIAPLIGPLSGSLFLQYYNWRGINLVIAFFAFIALIGLYFFFPIDSKVKVIAKQKNENFFKETASQYKSLFKNKKFILGVLAFSFAELPIIIWIALSPVMLMRKAELPRFEYGLFQIPVFGSFILGVIFLQFLIKKADLEILIKIGTVLIGIGLISSFIFSILLNQHHFVMVFAFSLYSLGLGLVSSPITRLLLFSSELPKGIVSALFSVMLVIILALGTEMANILYSNFSNIKLAGYLSVLYLVYASSLYFFMNAKQSDKKQEIKESKIIG